MKLVIHTQEYENYGAHDWDGEGSCPQRWKAKGGSEYMVLNIPTNVPVDEIVELVRGEVEFRNDGFESMILGWEVEADEYLSAFERSQLEYEGSITYPEPRVDYADLKAVFDHEYAEWAADQDAIYYGA
jgi:hypothetical protein